MVHWIFADDEDAILARRCTAPALQARVRLSLASLRRKGVVLRAMPEFSLADAAAAVTSPEVQASAALVKKSGERH
jgi:hypothetical protein